MSEVPCPYSSDSSLPEDDELVEPPRYATRTFFLLAVGSKHCVQVVVSLRVVDLTWWNHPESIASHHKQLLRIIREQIVSVHFLHDIVQASTLRNREKETKKETNRTDVVVVNNKGHQTSKKKSKSKAKLQERQTKRSKDAETQQRMQSMPQETKDCATVATATRTYSCDFKILMGDTIQVTYKLQPLHDIHQGCILTYDSSSEEDDHDDVKELGNPNQEQRQWKRVHSVSTLPQRIVLWCFPFDSSNPTKPIPFEDGGFPRQDMIPMASLFKEPLGH